jgi:Gpi18-like mannosyltransferase
LLLAIGVALRIVLLPLVTVDTDLYLRPWIAHADAVGSRYLSAPFTNYAPAYEHILYLCTFFAGVPGVYRIKFASYCFDAAMAAFVYAAVARRRGRRRALVAAGTVFVLPTVVVNSAFWGQCDSLYASFLLAALLFAQRGKPVHAALAASCALAFKLQAAFFVPVLALLWLGRRQPGWTFLLLPLGYVAASLPMLLAARGFGETLLVYAAQAHYFNSLSLNAPNLWSLLKRQLDHDSAFVPGMIAACVAIALLMLWMHRRKVQDLPRGEGVFLISAIMLLAVPFLAPRMHERYFYPADPVLVILAFSYAGYRAPFLLSQGASILAAIPFSDMHYRALAPLFGPQGAVTRATGAGYGIFPAAGAILMAAALFLLVRRASKLSRQTCAGDGKSGRATLPADGGANCAQRPVGGEHVGAVFTRSLLVASPQRRRAGDA